MPHAPPTPPAMQLRKGERRRRFDLLLSGCITFMLKTRCRLSLNVNLVATETCQTHDIKIALWKVQSWTACIQSLCLLCFSALLHCLHQLWSQELWTKKIYFRRENIAKATSFKGTGRINHLWCHYSSTKIDNRFIDIPNLSRLKINQLLCAMPVRGVLDLTNKPAIILSSGY